jgi:hypothetical protein
MTANPTSIINVIEMPPARKTFLKSFDVTFIGLLKLSLLLFAVFVEDESGQLVAIFHQLRYPATREVKNNVLKR